MSHPNSDTPDASDLAAWERELDRVEADVTAAERLLDERELTEVEAWTAPEGLGPLPAELADRVFVLLERMMLLQGELPAAEEQIRRQLGATRRVADATSQVRRTSLYIDTSA